MNGLRASRAIAKRELIRMVRQPTRIVASVATPLMIWVFLAGGFSAAMNTGAPSFTAHMIPGVASLTVMFSSIFASISLIQDRHDGFLRAALISPAPRWSIVLGKVGAGTLVALIQGLLVLSVIPFIGGERLTLGGFLLAALGLALVSASLISLGLALAWIVDSSQGFHGVMNSVLMPLWITSGAVFPVNEAASWLKVVAMCNPLTWMHSTMRAALNMDPVQGLPVWGAWCVSIGTALVCLALATKVMGARSRAL